MLTVRTTGIAVICGPEDCGGGALLGKTQCSWRQLTCPWAAPSARTQEGFRFAHGENTKVL